MRITYPRHRHDSSTDTEQVPEKLENVNVGNEIHPPLCSISVPLATRSFGSFMNWTTHLAKASLAADLSPGSDSTILTMRFPVWPRDFIVFRPWRTGATSGSPVCRQLHPPVQIARCSASATSTKLSLNGPKCLTCSTGTQIS